MENESKQGLVNLFNTASSWVYGRPMAPLNVDDVMCGASCMVESVQENMAAASVNGATIEGIAQKIASCTHCGLCKNRTHTVPGFGSAKPLVMVIGEGPGAEEDAQGLPFVGSAGQLLDKMLASIQLSRHTNCFIGNIVKCRPPHNRDPSPDESAACASFLQAQIHVLRPKMILAVGRIAAQNLLGTTEGIGKLHGRFFDYPPIVGADVECASIPLMATYHPSALLRDSSYKKPAWDDLKLFRTHLENIMPYYAEQASNGQYNGSGGAQ